MQNIYIHIGRGKTGTTRIQSFLAQKRKELLSQSIHYIYAGDRGTGCGHQQFAKSFIPSPPEYMVPAQNPENIQRKTRQEILKSKAKAILMSSENFAISNVSEVQAFFDNLPREFNVKIVYFVRSQDEVAESEYNQMVKLKRETCSFKTYADTKLEGCDYFEVAAEWEEAFGYENMICKIFNARTNNILDEFMACIAGLEPELLSPYSQYERPDSANQSLGFKATSVLRLLNAIDLNGREKLYARLRSQFSADDLPALFFDSNQAREFRAKFASTNRAFSERYIKQAMPDLAGRRNTDDERDQLREAILELKLDGY